MPNRIIEHCLLKLLRNIYDRLQDTIFFRVQVLHVLCSISALNSFSSLYIYPTDSDH